MMTVEEKRSIRTWCYEHSIGLIYLGIIVLVIIASLLVADKIYFDVENFMRIVESNIEYGSEIRENALYSNNCDDMKSGVASLLSSGANKDSWLPNKDDVALKNGLDRIEVLCQ
jgi:hypothetical protein